LNQVNQELIRENERLRQELLAKSKPKTVEAPIVSTLTDGREGKDQKDGKSLSKTKALKNTKTTAQLVSIR